MMGRREGGQGQFFYAFDLDQVVPADHLVRQIDGVIDLSWVHKELAPYYSDTGRPSIDPVLMIRMLIVGYVFAIRYYQHNLVAVDGPMKTATFEKVSEQNKGERITVPFDMLHVSPPQSPPDEIKSSPLVNAAGWVESTRIQCNTCVIRTYSRSATSIRRRTRRPRRPYASRRRSSSTIFST
jgi:hypothetical protein